MQTLFHKKVTPFENRNMKYRAKYDEKILIFQTALSITLSQ